MIITYINPLEENLNDYLVVNTANYFRIKVLLRGLD